MRFLVSWALYAAGGFVMGLDARCRWFHPLYCHLTVWSNRVQGNGAGPWSLDLRNSPYTKDGFINFYAKSGFTGSGRDL